VTAVNAEQLAIVNRPPTSRTLVEADPGTGKTFTLIARSVQLSAELDDSILVLSFTRAVVAEIRARAAENGGARLVARTIDGFAAHLLLAAGSDLAGSFDATIRAATRLVRERPELVPRPGHILIDEIQDLAGPRLDFVLALLAHARLGFTVLGDPKQAIYSWDGEPEDVFDLINATFDNVEHRRLSQIHRAKVAELLHDGVTDGERLLREAKPMGSLRQAALVLRRGDAVVLTRTNGEALVLAQLLSDLGGSVVARQGAQARMAPAWIASFVNASPRNVWNRRHALETLPTVTGAPPADEAWRVLRRLARQDEGVAAEALRRAAREPSGYDDCAFGDYGAVSTVHRAKGLEWDDVIVLEPLPEEHLADDERRVLFVAATRARREVWRLRRPDFGGRLVAGRGGRWERQTWQRRPVAIELKIGDVRLDHPFTTDGHSASAVQRRLADLTIGAPVLLVLDSASKRYLVECDGCPIAEATEEFSAAVGLRWGKPAKKLVGGRIVAVRSAAGDPADGEAVGLPGTGLWLAPEVVGLVEPAPEQEKR